MARKLIVEIIGDADQFQRELKKSQKQASGFGKHLGKLKFAAFGAAAGGAVLLGKGLKDSASAALEAEKAQTRLKSALKNAGVSYDRQGKQIEKAIDRTSKLAALDDEDLSDAFAKLVRTMGSVEKATEGMALAADIARARNISLEAATKIVEKASIGQTRGLKAIGVEIGKNTTSTEALERAQRKFSGSAARYGDSAAGAQDKLSVAFENLQEKVGQHLLPVLQKLALRLVDLIEWAEVNFPKFRAAFLNAFDKVAPTIQKVVAIVRGVVKILHGIFTGDWAEVWKGFRLVVVNEVKLLLSFLKTFGKLVVELIAKPINSVIDAINAIRLPSTKIPGIQGGTFGGKGIDPFPNIPRISVGGGTTTVNVNLDGKVVAQSTTRQQQKNARANPRQKRGPISVQPQ